MTMPGSVVPWPNPSPGQAAQVIVDGMPLELVPGKYSVEEADRFGTKVSQGTLKYADFNPFENAWAISALVGGAGLRRYSDAPTDNPEDLQTLYEESNNVNCAFAPVVLSPEITYHPLPGATGPAVWIGEDYRGVETLAKRLLAVAPVATGTGVFQRSTTGPWALVATITGKPNAIGTAIGVFGGVLVVGFGDATTAVTIDAGGIQRDLTQAASEPGGAVPLYVWAYTSDHAANYIAGGPSNLHFYRVMSSTGPTSGYAQAVSTGDTLITGLAPGGGLALVFVGKIDGLGEIDQQAVYHDLIPFDSRMATNCLPTKWMMASGNDQARGTMTLVFPRERSLWEYAPADQFSGSASAIAPWAATFRRPPNARGLVTAIVGTSRWLYYAVQNGAGATWIWRNDQSTGAPHTYLFLGTQTVRAMAVTHLYTGNPILCFSANNLIGEVVLPLDGDAELDDPASRYAAEGYVDLPDVDLGFPDEDKIGFSVNVISDNLLGLNRYHRVDASIDGGNWITLGTITTSPSGTVSFPLQSKAKRIKLRIWFFTDDHAETPQLWGVSLRLSLNTKVYRLFVFQTRLPGGSFGTLAEDLQNPYLQILHAWRIRRAGFPFPFADPWNDPFQTRLIKLQQQEALREPDKTPEWVMDWTLLEFVIGSGDQGPPIDVTTFVYDMDWTTDPAGHPDQANLYGYDQQLAIYDSQDPV